MKKFLSVAFLLASSLAGGMAQVDNSLIFVNKDGNEVPDGTEVTAYAVEETSTDDWGTYTSVVAYSGLNVKNATGESVAAMVEYGVESLPSGSFQICFPINCIYKETTGTWTTGGDNLAAGSVRDLQSEWFPAEQGQYGTARAYYQLKVCQYNPITHNYVVLADGPRVTVNFVYSENTSVSAPSEQDARPAAFYTPGGQQLAAPQRGITIVRLANGKAVKRLVR